MKAILCFTSKIDGKQNKIQALKARLTVAEGLENQHNHISEDLSESESCTNGSKISITSKGGNG